MLKWSANTIPGLKELYLADDILEHQKRRIKVTGFFKIKKASDSHLEDEEIGVQVGWAAIERDHCFFRVVQLVKKVDLLPADPAPLHQSAPTGFLVEEDSGVCWSYFLSSEFQGSPAFPIYPGVLYLWGRTNPHHAQWPWIPTVF